MDPTFKNALVGGILNSLGFSIPLGIHLGYPELLPKELKDRIDPHLPVNLNLITLGGGSTMSAATWKMARSQRVKDIGMGGVMQGVPRLLSRIAITSLQAESPVQAPPGFSHRAAAPYVTKAEYLPFQTDLTY
ncbi:MAG: hypothetical protein ACE5L6_02090 [Candidatus Bathyarchaeia archaeon]